MDQIPYIMTPKQVAQFLQINPETVYRYIRQGKLTASRLGRSYRITRDSVDRLLLITRNPLSFPVRHYGRDELVQFVKDDQLAPSSEAIVERFIADREAKRR